MATRNPWLNLKEEALKIRTPILILNAQADMLEEATEGLIKGIVEIKEERAHGKTTVVFAVLVPRLNNYRVRLFSVSQPISQYPATLMRHWGRDTNIIRCESEEELETAVVAYCKGGEVQKIVTGLLAQAGQTMGS